MLHRMASDAEHVIDAELRSQLDDELNRPQIDPHGQAIPEEELGDQSRELPESE